MSRFSLTPDQKRRRDATKSAAAGTVTAPRGPGFGTNGMFFGPSPQPKPGAPTIPPGQPLTTHSPAERATFRDRFPTFEAEAAHAKRLMGPPRSPMGGMLPAAGADTPLLQRDRERFQQHRQAQASAATGPTLAELTGGPNMGPKKPGATPADVDEARRAAEERMADRRTRALIGLSPGFTSEDADAAAAARADRHILEDAAVLRRQPREVLDPESPEFAAAAARRLDARNRLNSITEDYLREQLADDIGPEVLARLEAGEQVALTPEQRQAIAEYSQSADRLARQLPRLDETGASELTREAMERFARENEHLEEQQSAARSPTSALSRAMQQADEAEDFDELLRQAAEAEIKARTAQSEQAVREANAAGRGGEKEGGEPTTPEALQERRVMEEMVIQDPQARAMAQDLQAIGKRLAGGPIAADADDDVGLFQTTALNFANYLNTLPTDVARQIAQRTLRDLVISGVTKEPGIAGSAIEGVDSAIDVGRFGRRAENTQKFRNTVGHLIDFLEGFQQ